MLSTPKPRTFDDAIAWLRQYGCEVTSVGGRTRVKKGVCAGELEAAPDGTARTVGHSGVLMDGEIARLTDKGFQKFWKNSKRELPASAEHLKEAHQFAELLREAIGATSLYNEALGTVSDRYVYDRVVDRDTAETARKPHAWEQKSI